MDGEGFVPQQVASPGQEACGRVPASLGLSAGSASELGTAFISSRAGVHLNQGLPK